MDYLTKANRIQSLKSTIILGKSTYNLGLLNLIRFVRRCSIYKINIRDHLPVKYEQQHNIINLFLARYLPNVVVPRELHDDEYIIIKSTLLEDLLYTSAKVPYCLIIDDPLECPDMSDLWKIMLNPSANKLYLESVVEETFGVSHMIAKEILADKDEVDEVCRRSKAIFYSTPNIITSLKISINKLNSKLPEIQTLYRAILREESVSEHSNSDVDEVTSKIRMMLESKDYIEKLCRMSESTDGVVARDLRFYSSREYLIKELISYINEYIKPRYGGDVLEIFKGPYNLRRNHFVLIEEQYVLPSFSLMASIEAVYDILIDCNLAMLISSDDYRNILHKPDSLNDLELERINTKMIRHLMRITGYNTIQWLLKTINRVKGCLSSNALSEYSVKDFTNSIEYLEQILVVINIYIQSAIRDCTDIWRYQNYHIDYLAEAVMSIIQPSLFASPFIAVNYYVSNMMSSEDNYYVELKKLEPLILTPGIVFRCWSANGVLTV